jgi:hypothetical protein
VLVVRKNILIVIAATTIIAGYVLWQFSYEQANSATAQSANQTSTKIEYHASFICGVIEDSSGPLRPGYYDTDINIYNKQGFMLPLLWKAVLNDGASSNFKIKNLEAVSSTAISCEQIRSALEHNSESYIQGFVVLRAELSPEIIGALYSGKGGTVVEQPENLDVLNVQSIHTVNALEGAVKTTILAKVAFVITSDESGKVPVEMLSKRLYAVIPATEYEVFDAESEVKQILAKKFELDQNDAVKIRIVYTNFMTHSLGDDHALAVQQVKPVSAP